jgi:acetyl esterase/lipase
MKGGETPRTHRPPGSLREWVINACSNILPIADVNEEGAYHVSGIAFDRSFLLWYTLDRVMVMRISAALLMIGLVVLAAGAFLQESESKIKVMTVRELLALKPVEADFKVSYGDDPLQFGELRMPEGEGPFPVVVIIHGGCWMSAYNLNHISAMAGAVTGLGYATWSLEYRRIGDEGGGWPGTFADVADGIDFLRPLAGEHPIDPGRVLVMGHSAGGHLALWAGGRRELPPESPLYRKDPLIPSGIVSLAGIGDLATAEVRKICGTAVMELMGGGNADVPDRYAQGSPAELLPLGVRQILVQGALDTVVPADSVKSYLANARAAGDPVEMTLVDSAGHYELITPGSNAWAAVKGALAALLK